MIHLTISILAIIVVNYIANYFGEKVKIPSIVIMIALGLLINIPLFHEFVIYNGGAEVISTLGNFGLICLMLIAGFGSSINNMKKERIPATIISILGLITPFILGLVTLKLFGYSRGVALIAGIALSITAEATTAKVLLDSKKLKSKVGTAMLEAGILDDIVGLSIFILIGFFFNSVSPAEYLVVVTSIGAFFVGAFIKKHIGRHHIGIKKIEKRVGALIIPFLFINIGMHFDFSAFSVSIWFVLAIILAAFGGKFIGTLLAKKYTDFSRKQILLIARAMNSRGAIGLAIALVALQLNTIPVTVYSALVINALITTIAFPFVYAKCLKKNLKIMN